MAIDTEERKPGNTKTIDGQAQSGAKKSNKKLVIIIVAVVAALIVLSIIGAVVSGLIAKKVFESGVEAVTDGKVQIDADGSDGEMSYTFEGEDGSMSIDSSQDLPADLPSVTPLYDNADLVHSTTTTLSDEGTSYSLSFTSSDSLQDVYAFYEAELSKSGWEVGFSRSSSGQGASAMISATNQDANTGVMFSAASSQDQPGTEFSLTVRDQLDN